MTRQIPPEQLQRLKDDNPCNVVAERFGVKLRRHGTGFIGQCPLCSADPQKAGTRFEAFDDHWVCAACEQGGDVIRLVMLREGRDFLGAVEWLGGVREVDAAEAQRRADELAAARAERERTSANYREAERATLFRIWCEAPRAIAGTSAEAYLKLRGIAVPPTMRLRCAEAQPYYVPGDKPGAWRVIHTGPAMLAPLIGRDGKFAGLHMTYIDLTKPKGKAELVHDGEPLPAKKVRGSKKGSRIVLYEPPIQSESFSSESPLTETSILQLVLGEGIEKTAAVWMALEAAGRDLAASAFWVAGDIGNMGGKSSGPVTHPELRTEKNRPRRVPGPDPDPDDAGIPVPDSVTDLVLLGDSTSDPFTTRCAMYRAQQRYARPGRTVRMAWAPSPDHALEAARTSEPMDFDDMVRGMAA